MPLYGSDRIRKITEYSASFSGLVQKQKSQVQEARKSNKTHKVWQEWQPCLWNGQERGNQSYCERRNAAKSTTGSTECKLWERQVRSRNKSGFNPTWTNTKHWRVNKQQCPGVLSSRSTLYFWSVSNRHVRYSMELFWSTKAQHCLASNTRNPRVRLVYRWQRYVPCWKQTNFAL